MNPRRFLHLAFLIVATATIAQAHPGHDGHEPTWDFSAGVLHPLSGWDHLLAMISIGLWAASIGGRARWVIPATFVSTMAVFALFAPLGAVPSFVEQGIAASILGLGLLLASGVRLPISVGLLLAGIFAAFHGWAHGAELPSGSSAWPYGAGFVLSTIFLHAVGLALGYSAQHYPRLIRATGVSVAVVGLVAMAAS